MVAKRGSVRLKAGAAASASTPAAGSASSSPSASALRSSSSSSSRHSGRGDGPYKLLALDLDGTLLDRSGEASPADLAAIRKLKARGIVVTILTGRLFSGTRPSAALLGIDGPVGCADGSHVVHVKEHKTLLHRGICGRAAERLRQSIHRNDVVAFLFAEDAVVHDHRGEDYLPYVRTWSTDLRRAERVTDHALWKSNVGMTAVVALGRQGPIGRTVEDIQRDENEAMQVSMFPFRRDADTDENHHWGMVARAAGGTKGTALAWMAEHHGIELSETVCVGDWLNDVPMLEAAGRSFAMGQAPFEVKSAATDVLTRTITTGGGIAEAIERAFG